MFAHDLQQQDLDETLVKLLPSSSAAVRLELTSALQISRTDPMPPMSGAKAFGKYNAETWITTKASRLLSERYCGHGDRGSIPAHAGPIA
jgi:hypothetical protein